MGAYRTLTFEVTAPGPMEADYIGYVPGAANSGLTESEKMFHGWDQQQILRFWKYPLIKTARVYVDDPAADRFEFGVASGLWRTIDKVKNPLSA